ncbi:MAG TPA: hypothetical protein VFG23_00115 [Polyangia bacterium]|nr:hypothetical protein [Polyangia bacterium]
MSSIFRKTLVCLIAVFALGAIAASAASAVTDPTTQQQFVEKNGKEVIKKGFTSKEGISTLSVPLAGTTVECKADTDKGNIDAGWNESVEKVVVTFTGCKVKVTVEKVKQECPINSIKEKVKAKEGEIVTVTLKGELGESAESATGVVLLLEPASGIEFVTLAATGAPCKTIETKVNGQVAGEVTPLALGLTDKVVFENKIKVLERSFAKHCTGGVNCTEDGEVKPKLEAFAFPATFASTDENTFEEKVEVLPGA